ncbi:DUF4381 domain-containing protein [Shewanella sp. WXL01]|uniref:DUF4381 domain-containing protein n=1 Tax=Shewanella sp. WXL01 TaxID=2709721 RepID=UPI0014385AB6|nr:DUF4381 domain-containing protein [Shewanella sp. WXL01]NKF51142.1 DUF4381 domain-containing protein [Shewanella sp. WXL01]
MTPQSPLAQMQDIMLPEPIHNWPIAYGYWIVLAIIITVLCYLILAWRKKRRLNAAKKQTLTLLNQLNDSAADYPQQVNALLKRLALSYLPREQVANLSGAKWTEFLDARMAPAQQGQLGKLLNMRYQKQGLNTEQTVQLKQLATSYITSKTTFTIPTDIKPKQGAKLC